MDLTALTHRFLEQVRGIPDYADPPLPWAQISQDALESFSQLVSCLRTGDSSHLASVATQVGVTRARAAIPLASLLTAIRLDFSLLWQELIAVGRPDEAAILLRHASVVSEVVEKYIQQTQHAYLTEERRMADDVASVRRGLVAELLSDRPQSEDRLLQVGQQLEIGVNWKFTVFAAFEDQTAGLRVESANLERQGAQVLTAHHGSALVLIAPHNPAQAPRELTAVQALRVGMVDQVTGLSRLGAAARMAEQLATVFEPHETGVMTPVRGWSRLVRQQVLQTPLAGIITLDGFQSACGPAEREAIESTVRSFLLTGSVAATAAQLYCHRNTVTNRLRRFAELTGIDLMIPAQAARAVIAFA